MKKLLGILCCLFLFTASMCENEPLDNDIIQNVANEECEQATISTASAAEAYSQVTEDNYTEICNVYKAALNAQIQSCGDNNGGNLQALINALGDCSNNNQTDCETITLATNAAQTAFENASSEDYSSLCVAYKTALQLQIQSCGDTDGSLQVKIDALGDCTLGGGGGNTDSHAFMTANIDGIQYNDMRPNGYLFFPQGVLVNDFFSRPDDDYILIQGNSGYRYPTYIDVTDREINLRLPSTYWKEGTFALYDEYNDVFEGVCFYTFFRSDYPSNITKKDLVGEIIVSKFSLEEKVIQGTFEFEYMLVDDNDNSETGPYKVTGTFDYPLDDDFFN